MQVVQSIDSHRDEIGVRSACHVDLVWRHVMRGPEMQLDKGFLRVITGELHPMGNLAIVSSPSDAAITQAAIGPLVDTDLPVALLYSRGASDAIAQSLVGLGFQAAPMPAMAIDIERVATTSLPDGCAFLRVGVDESDEWAEAMADGFALPLGLARRFAPKVEGADMAPDATIQFFAVVKDGRQVATTMLYLADGLAGIYCVATLPGERGKGLAAHLTAEALRLAHRAGYRVGVLQSSPSGHPVYRRLGFEDVSTVPMFVRQGNRLSSSDRRAAS